MPPIDGDGPSYAVAAREMVATGDFATVRVQTDMQPWQPHGMQWLEAATLLATGQTRQSAALGLSAFPRSSAPSPRSS